MIAIALPMTLLLACGGGGGGGTVAVGTPTTMTPNDPNTPPTTNDPNTPPIMVRLEDLPTALITNPATARSRVTGSAQPSTSLDSSQIQNMFRSRATGMDGLVTSDAYVISPAMPSGMDTSSNSINLDGTTFTTSLNNVATDIGNRFGLIGVRSEYSLVMVHQGATLAQHRAAGRNDDSDVFEYLSYGGWFANSAFSVDMLTINDDSNESSALIGVSYGDATGSRPTRYQSGVLGIWNGVIAGINKNDGDIIQGGFQIEVDIASSMANINFINIVNITDGNTLQDMLWSVSIATEGTFSSTTGGDIDGTFYGTEHTEVGGTFNRDNIIGAFGGTRRQ